GPDVDELLGPAEPPDDALAYLRGVASRAGRYFADVIPLALHVMTHPSFDPSTLARMQPRGSAVLQDGLAQRIASLARRGQIVTPSAATTARLLLSLAHDWGLGSVFGRGTSSRHLRELTDMVDMVWKGLRPPEG